MFDQKLNVNQRDVGPEEGQKKQYTDEIYLQDFEFESSKMGK